jgi:hypothetical protein
MKFEHVKSQALRFLKYDRKAHILDVVFQNGALYRYFDVPVRVYLQLIGAASKGTFFNKQLKARGFRYERVN